WGAVGEFVEDFPTLALVEGLFFTHPHHRTTVRRIGSTAQWYLVLDGSAIDEPTDRSNIGPGQRWVVEDRGVFGLAVEQILNHLVARGSKGFSCRVQVETVTGFVLHLGHQNHFALQR